MKIFTIKANSNPVCDLLAVTLHKGDPLCPVIIHKKPVKTLHAYLRPKDL